MLSKYQLNKLFTLLRYHFPPPNVFDRSVILTCGFVFVLESGGGNSPIILPIQGEPGREGCRDPKPASGTEREGAGNSDLVSAPQWLSTSDIFPPCWYGARCVVSFE